MAKFLKSLQAPWIRRLPEFGLFPSEEELDAAMKVVAKRTTGTAAYGVGLMLLIVGLIIVCQNVGVLVRSALPFASDIVLFAALGVSCSITYAYAVVWLCRRRIQRVLRERLLELGVPVCLRCGYDLRGQTVPRCPECGREFDPALLSKSEPTSTSGESSE